MPTILVVDDEDVSLYVLSRMLGKAGYQVITANDGVEALEKLAAQRADLVLSDIMMPRMDGTEMLRHIRRESRYDGIPVILATSTPTEWLEPQECVARLIQKPFDFQRLLAVIAELLAKGRSSA